jgi:competence protein ComEA
MRSRKSANDHVAEVARRRLELLTAELAQVSRALPAAGEEAPAQSPAAGSTQAPPVASADPPPDPPPDLPTDPRSGDVERRPRGRHARRSLGTVARISGWVHDRLPPTLQGRVQIGASHLTVVALLVAAALAVTAWWVVRADGGGTLVPAAMTENATPETPVAVLPAAESEAPAPGRPSASTGQVIVIDVAGKVRRPGIATLPLGSRVVDALEAAGGVRSGVDLTSLNLARLLVDGEQIVVGVPPPAGVAAPAASAPGTSGSGLPGPLVNLNTATQTELETLPGIGPVTATAILQWRTDNGAFTAVDELLEVAGIGDATLAEIAPFVTI